MTKRTLVLFFIICLAQTATLKGQETMMQDVSYVYLEKLIATAKENYPRMDSFEGKIKVAQSALSHEQMSWADAFSFSYVYNPNNTLDLVNPNFFNGYQLAFNVNLGSLLQKPSKVKQARETAKIAQYDLAEYHLLLEAEVKRRYFAYIQALNVLKLQTRIASDALSIIRDNKAKYEKSEMTFEQYSVAQMSYTTAAQSKIDAEASFLTAKANLEELIAKKIEEVR